jgi:hypothetical protein
MKQFRCRKAEMVLYMICIIFLWGIIVVSYNNPTSTLLVKLGFFCFGLSGCYFLFQSFIVITLDDYSIKIKYPFIAEKEIYYSNIASLGDSNAYGKLILRDLQNRKILQIRKNIIGIAELKEMLKSKIPVSHNSEVCNHFRMANSSLASFLSVVIMSVSASIFFFIKGGTVNGVISLFCTGYFLYLANRMPITICISNSSFTLNHIFKTRIIHMGDIKNIYQDADNKAGNELKTFTIIETKDDKKISLTNYSPDDETLFQSCKHYFDNQKCAI